MAFLAKRAPHTPITRELIGFEAPMSNRKAREILGFKEEHNWRKYALGRDRSPAEAR
jgi:UDP-glucose 4-epimerase